MRTIFAVAFAPVPDPIFTDPRLARIYDPLDPDRSDLDSYLNLIHEVEARAVLDVGCGTGTLACLLAERGIDVVAVAIAVSAEMEALEQAEIANEDGPCYEAYRKGKLVIANDLEHSDVDERWPTVIERMRALDLHAVYAFPLRLGDDVIGALNLYRDSPGDLADDDIRAARAFADIAAIGILQQRRVTSAVQRAEQRAEQLQHALDSRIVIEQAKGIVCAQRGLSLGEAFDVIRSHARGHNRKVHDVARAIIDNGSEAIGD